MVGWPVSADLILLPLMCVEQCTFLIFLLCEKNAFYFHSTTKQRPNLWLFCFKGTITRHVSTNKWSHQACTLQKVNNNIKSQQKLQKRTSWWQMWPFSENSIQRIQWQNRSEYGWNTNSTDSTSAHCIQQSNHNNRQCTIQRLLNNNCNKWHHTMRETKQLLWRLLFNRNMHAGLTTEGMTTQLCMNNVSQP